MIQKLLFSVVLILAMIGFAGCDADLRAGIIKELADNQDGIRQELGELWDAFLEEANEWSESAATFSITDDHDLEYFSKILRKVRRSGNHMAALSSLAGVSPPASSALPRNPRPHPLFSHYFRELL